MKEAMKNGIKLYRKGSYADALIQFLEHPAGEVSTNLELAYFIGLCYARLERYEDALVYLEQVVTADTDLARVYQCRILLALVYSLTGRTRLASFELQKTIEAGYESPQVYCSLGYVAYENGSSEEAITWYEKALSLDESNATALNGLGFVLADTGADYTRALTMCKKALDADPDNHAYLDSVGWVYHKLGFEQESLIFTQRALKKAPNNLIIQKHLKEIQSVGGFNT